MLITKASLVLDELALALGYLLPDSQPYQNLGRCSDTGGIGYRGGNRVITNGQGSTDGTSCTNDFILVRGPDDAGSQVSVLIIAGAAVERDLLTNDKRVIVFWRCDTHAWRGISDRDADAGTTHQPVAVG